MATLLEVLLLPPLGPLLLILLGLIITRRWKRQGLMLAWAGFGVLVILSIPAVSGSMLAGLQPDAPLDFDAPLGVDAIVVLSADTDPGAPEFGGANLGPWTLQRVRYGAALQRRTGLPMLMTGGPGRYGLQPLAEVMSRVAADEFSAPTRWTENVSSTTFENASLSAPILEDAGVERICLVTHAWHMPRARACFEAQGFEVVAGPTAFRAPPIQGVGSFLPSWTGYRDASLALHEWLGAIYYRMFVV